MNISAKAERLAAIMIEKENLAAAKNRWFDLMEEEQKLEDELLPHIEKEVAFVFGDCVLIAHKIADNLATWVRYNRHM